MPSPLPCELPSLEHVQKHRKDYRGPISESNWVIPGHLLVGAFPASPNDEDTLNNLYSILMHGITSFVCLQEEYNPNVTPQQYKNNIGIRPYFKDLLHITSKVESYRQVKNIPYFNPTIAKPEDVQFLHFPIKDCKIAHDSQVYLLCLELARRLMSGEKLYIHCWGGHGRTGTIVSILLSILYNYDAPTAMQYCQFVHDLRKAYIQVSSPQTQLQRDQVTRIVEVIGNTFAYSSSNKSVPFSYHPYQHSNNSITTSTRNNYEDNFRQKCIYGNQKDEIAETKAKLCSSFDEQKSTKSMETIETFYPDMYEPSRKYHFARTDSNSSSSSSSTNSTSFPTSISEEVLSQVSSLTDSDESIDVGSITTDIDIEIDFDQDDENDGNGKLSRSHSNPENNFFRNANDREDNNNDMETIKK